MKRIVEFTDDIQYNRSLLPSQRPPDGASKQSNKRSHTERFSLMGWRGIAKRIGYNIIMVCIYIYICLLGRIPAHMPHILIAIRCLTRRATHANCARRPTTSTLPQCSIAVLPGRGRYFHGKHCIYVSSCPPYLHPGSSVSVEDSLANHMRELLRGILVLFCNVSSPSEVILMLTCCSKPGRIRGLSTTHRADTNNLYGKPHCLRVRAYSDF